MKLRTTTLFEQVKMAGLEGQVNQVQMDECATLVSWLSDTARQLRYQLVHQEWLSYGTDTACCTWKEAKGLTDKI